MEHIACTIARFRRQLVHRIKAHNGKPRGVAVKSGTRAAELAAWREGVGWPAEAALVAPGLPDIATPKEE